MLSIELTCVEHRKVIQSGNDCFCWVMHSKVVIEDSGEIKMNPQWDSASLHSFVPVSLRDSFSVFLICLDKLHFSSLFLQTLFSPHRNPCSKHSSCSQ